MIDSRVRLVGLVLSLAWLVPACSNQAANGGQPTAGTPVTVQVVDTAGHPVVGPAAAQLGDGGWLSIVPTSVGAYELVVPEGASRYGFAVNCPSGLQASSTKMVMFQATVEEATELLATCPRSFVGATTTVEGNFDASALGASYVRVVTDRDAFEGPPSTPTGSYGPLVTTAGQDRTVVAAAYNSIDNVLGLKPVRNLDLSAAANVNPTFSLADSILGFNTPDFSASVPPGFSPEVGVNVVFAPGISVNTWRASTSSVTTGRLLPNLDPDDTHLLFASATDSGPPLIQTLAVAYVDDPVGVDLDLPQLPAQTTTVVGTALPTYLDLSPIPNDPDFRGHSLVFAWDGIPPHDPFPNLDSDAFIHAFVTAGWLGAGSQYEIPDLTDLPGFAGAKALSGESASWLATSVASDMSTQALLSTPAYPRGWDTALFGAFPPPIVEGTVSRLVIVGDAFAVP